MKTYRKTDRRAPRFRVAKYRYTALNKELFDRFKEANPNVKMDYLFFKDTILSINEEIVNFVMDNREGVFLPSGMGRVYLGLFPPKERPLRVETIRNEGIHATHFNFDSNGFMGKIIWLFDDTRYKTENLKYYGFIGYRTFKNRASNAFRTEPGRYVREANMIRSHEFFKRKKNERNEINSEIGNQPSEDTEQGDECGFETNQ